MNALEQMRTSLSPLGLYNLRGGSLVDSELRSYFEGCNFTQERFNELCKSLWVSTADEKIISMWEQRLGLPREETLEERRKLVLSCLQSNKQAGCTSDEICDYLRKFVKFVYLYDDYPNFITRVCFSLGTHTLEDYALPVRVVRNLIPAHLRLTISLPSSDWDAMEAPGRTFEHWDAMGFHWDIHEDI